MNPQLTKFLGIFLPLILGSLHQPDIAALLAPHPIASYIVGAIVVAVGTYLGVGISGPTVAPKMAAALGNPGAQKPGDPPAPVA